MGPTPHPVGPREGLIGFVVSEAIWPGVRRERLFRLQDSDRYSFPSRCGLPHISVAVRIYLLAFTVTCN